MTQSTPYQLGRHHGLRSMPMYKFFTPEGCWEDTQYRQGYIDGSFATQKDIENAERARLSRLRTTTGT
jgi:hypothetical protein